MNLWIQLLQIILPSLLTAIVIYLVIKEFLTAEEKRKELEIRKSITQQTTPMKIQAYERMVIFFRTFKSQFFSRTSQ